MKRLRAWLMRWMGVFPNGWREDEFAAEIDSHLAMHIEDNVRAGMSPEQARRDAVRKLGGVEMTKQAYRERNTLPFVESLLQDVRFALRQLRKNPGFTCTAILMLTLGICASISIFAFVDAALIKPLPYREPSRLVGVFERTQLGSQYHLSYLDYLDWKRFNKVFESLEAYDGTSFLMNTATGAQRADGATVSDGFFRTLGVSPVLGRDFRSGEDLPSASRTVILSYAAFQRRFGGRANVLGETVTLDGVPNTIIGVLPREFHFAPAEPAEFWTTLHRSTTEDRGSHGLSAVARLKDGVSLEAASAELASIAAQLAKEYPDSNGGRGATVMALADVIAGSFRPFLLVLWGGAAMLLLIACVNVSSLLLVRSESRRREIAIRGALGASRARVAHQFITEGLMLAAMGSTLGVVCAAIVMPLLTRLIPASMLSNMPYLQGLGLNGHVMFFACVLSMMAAVLFASVPMVRLSSGAIHDGLAEGGRGSVGTMWRRLGANLVVIELAIAMVLLVAAGLLGQSFYHLLHVNTGFEPDHLAMMRVIAPKSSYSKYEQIVALERQVLGRLQSLPNVQAVSIASRPPVGNGGGSTTFLVVGRSSHGEQNEVNDRPVSPGYFSTIKARLLRGRYFTESEDASKPHVVIINQAFARQYFPGEDAIGKQIREDESSPVMEIVGIVENIKEGPLDVANRPVIYVPFDQQGGELDNYFYVVLRTMQAERTLLPAMAAAIHEIDPGITTTGGESMVDRINHSTSAYLHRSSAWLVGGFSAVALLLGVIGLYGVVAYSVSQRTREIGVRMALGARRSSVYQLILGEAGRLTVMGIGVGLVLSLAAAQLMRGLLFSVRSWDVPTLGSVAVVLGIAGLLASYIPARRAASVNPVETLRAE